MSEVVPIANIKINGNKLSEVTDTEGILRRESKMLND